MSFDMVLGDDDLLTFKQNYMKVFNRFYGIFLLAIGMVIAYFMANIAPDRCYGWFQGIWQGIHFVSNWILSFFIEGRLFKAPEHTWWYNFWWWITAVCWSMTTVMGVWRVFFPPKIVYTNNQNN